MRAGRLLILAGLCAGVAGPARAQPAPAPPAAQRPAPAPSTPAPAPAPSGLPAAPKPDPVFDAARRSFEALPDTERQRIQEALVWTGDLNGSADGAFGRRTFDAILAYQRRAKAEPSGILDERARAALAQTMRRAQEAAGFKVAADPATGIVIGIPERTLPKRGTNPRGGSRWQSADETITLDTRTMPPGETDLPALYERSLAVQNPGRQVTYKLLRPDFFVIAGETPTGRFYMRYAAGPSGIRGFSVGYDKSAAPDFERALIAVSNSFQPFPDPGRLAASGAAAAAVAAAPAAPGAGQAAVPLPPRPPAPPPVPRKPVLIATGLVVAPGQAVTSAAVDACPEPRVAGAKARVAQSEASGLRVLAFEGGPKPASLTAARAAPDAAVVVAAIATSFGPPAPVAAPGTMHGEGVSAPLQTGAGGAPVFDRHGALVGLVAEAPAAKRQIAGIVPATVYPTVPAAEIARATGRSLPEAGGGDERSAADLMAAVGGALVAIECLQ